MIKKFIYYIEFYAPSLLRYGMSAVILWFALAQLFNAAEWLAYVPDSITKMTGISAITLVYFNAIFELIFGVLLVFGWQTRIVAFLLAVHLFDIMYVVGYGEIGVRDFGLAVATLVVSMNGADPLCIQKKKKIINNVITENLSQPSPQTRRLI
jgi:uncharacterized membrane protein YphA (DoxX/SURF4 family)